MPSPQITLFAGALLHAHCPAAVAGVLWRVKGSHPHISEDAGFNVICCQCHRAQADVKDLQSNHRRGLQGGHKGQTGISCGFMFLLEHCIESSRCW